MSDLAFLAGFALGIVLVAMPYFHYRALESDRHERYKRIHGRLVPDGDLREVGE